MEPELAELFVYLQNCSYHDYDYAKEHYTGFHSTSLAEKRFLSLTEDNPTDLIKQTTWRILRLYPDGLRQDSSNPYPVDGWNHGVQMVALNHQNDGDEMSLYYGKFLDNGGCGYVLKPDYLLNAEKTNYSPLSSHINFDHPMLLTIQIISGQFLPRSSLKTSDIPDPYVHVSIHGLPCDRSEKKNKSY